LRVTKPSSNVVSLGCLRASFSVFSTLKNI